MRYVRAFGRFWWDFIVGDDWVVAAAVGLGLVLTGILTGLGVDAWWLLAGRRRARARRLAPAYDSGDDYVRTISRMSCTT